MPFQICHTWSSVSNSYHRMSKCNGCGWWNTFWAATFIIILSVIFKWIQLWKLLHWQFWRNLLSLQKIISMSLFYFSHRGLHAKAPVLTFGLSEKLEIIQNIFSPYQHELEFEGRLKQSHKIIAIPGYLRKYI